jgi:hypothetical protein
MAETRRLPHAAPHSSQERRQESCGQEVWGTRGKKVGARQDMKAEMAEECQGGSS